MIFEMSDEGLGEEFEHAAVFQAAGFAGLQRRFHKAAPGGGD